jgi:hypothetical protein
LVHWGVFQGASEQQTEDARKNEVMVGGGEGEELLMKSGTPDKGSFGNKDRI